MTNPVSRAAPPSGWFALVRVLGWEHIFVGTLSLIGAGFLLLAPPEEGPPFVLFPIYAVAGAALVVAGAGLLAYRGWARTLAIVLALLVGSAAFLPLLFQQPPQPLALIHALVTIGLLTRGHVRRIFGASV
jgi:hypothetical protein